MDVKTCLFCCSSVLVWTPCLMHRCVDLTVHITKLQLQITFSKPLYIPHSTCIHGTPVIENLDVCTACDPWDSYLNIQLICWVCYWYWYQNLRGGPPGAGRALPRQQHMRRGGLFIYVRVFFLIWCHPWMNDETNGWMKKVSWKTTMMSLQISWSKFVLEESFLPSWYDTHHGG
jgi:hypothetical protein